MFLIKNNETTLTIWWKFIGSIVVLIFLFFVAQEDTFFVPVKGEVITRSNHPIMFPLLLIFCGSIASLSLWQGGYGIYQKHIVQSGNVKAK